MPQVMLQDRHQITLPKAIVQQAHIIFSGLPKNQMAIAYINGLFTLVFYIFMQYTD